MKKLIIHPFIRIEFLQHNACLAKRRPIKGTSKEKFYDELGLESLHLCYWFRKLCYFYKLYNNKSPQYLLKLAPLWHSSYITRNTENIPLFKTNIIFSKIYFLPQLLLSVTDVTITFEKSKTSVFLKTIS